MAALYSHTTRTTGTILTATIYNADHQNHIDNGIPAQLDDYSVNVAQMQLSTDPGEVGTESLAGNLGGELERIRFVLAEIKNRLNGGVTPQWYATASGAVSGTTGTFSGAVSGTTGTFTGNVSGVAGTFSGAVSGTTGTFTGNVSGVAGTFTGALTTSAASVGADMVSSVTNSDNTNGASRARLSAAVGGASAGDALVLLTVTGATDWSIGIDNSDSDNLKIGPNFAVGTSTSLTITTAGVATFSSTVNAISFIASATIRGASLQPEASAIPANGMYLPAANEVGFATNSGKRLAITSDGRLYGTALHDNAGAVTGTTNQYIASGTYTPTLTNVLNITGSTSAVCQWIRVGNVVTVSGTILIDPTTASTISELDISLPIASDLTAGNQLGGVGFVGGSSVSTTEFGGGISGETANNRARYDFFCATDAANQTHCFSFQYVVV